MNCEECNACLNGGVNTMEVHERRIVEHCVEHYVLGGKNTARFLSAFLSHNSLSCRYKFQHACSEKQSLSLNVPWQMDLSSKAKITHPLVLAVCMENAKTIERIAQIRTF